MDIFMPYLTVNTDGFFIRQYMDTASLPDNTSFLFLSSDSEEDEEGTVRSLSSYPLFSLR